MRFIFALTAALIPVAAFAQQAAAGAKSSMFGSVLPMMVIMFVIIYFLMIRPEQRKAKQRQLMINEMKKGDKVLTIGGIYGVVVSVKNDVVVVKIADNTTVEMTKSAVSNVVVKEGASKEEPAKESK